MVVSNQATERVVELYESLEFELEYVDGPRRISRSGDRTPAREIIGTRSVDGTWQDAL